MNVYACGALFYFLLAAKPPPARDPVQGSPRAMDATDATDDSFFGTHRTTASAVPANLRAVIKRALATDPRHRFNSVADLDAAVAAATRAISQRSSQPDIGARVSGMGVTPIGLRSSAPPDLLSSYPPQATAADSGSEAVTPAERHAPQWSKLVLPSAAGACVALFIVARFLLAPNPSTDPTSKRGALARQSQQEPSFAPSKGLPLTARVQIRELQVQGGAVPASLVKRATVRLQSQFKRCYEQSARAAGHNRFGELSVSVQIDANGRAHSAQVKGADLPELDACITQGLSNIHSEAPKDGDNMLASFKIAFMP
jgi:serine/threonine protein kinase